MASETYALVVNGIVQELVAVPAGTSLGSIAASNLNYVDVTSQNPFIVIGQSATLNGTVWTFGPAPSVPSVPVVPHAVSRYQLKAALAGTAAPAGSTGSLMDAVAAWVASQPETTQIMWTDAPSIRRTGPFITAAIAHFGWTGSQVDAWFVAAIASANAV